MDADGAIAARETDVKTEELPTATHDIMVRLCVRALDLRHRFAKEPNGLTIDCNEAISRADPRAIFRALKDHRTDERIARIDAGTELSGDDLPRSKRRDARRKELDLGESPQDFAHRLGPKVDNSVKPAPEEGTIDLVGARDGRSTDRNDRIEGTEAGGIRGALFRAHADDWQRCDGEDANAPNRLLHHHMIDFGRDGRGDDADDGLFAAALDPKIENLIRALLHDPFNVVVGANAPPVDLEYAIARHQEAVGGHPRRDLSDERRMQVGICKEDKEEKRERKGEAHQWACQDDQHPRDDRLPIERAVKKTIAIAFGEIGLAEELDIPADREKGENVFRPKKADSGEAGTKAETEADDMDAKGLGDQKMPKLVHKDEAAHKEREREK